jgi:hypothetical protein
MERSLIIGFKKLGGTLALTAGGTKVSSPLSAFRYRTPRIKTSGVILIILYQYNDSGALTNQRSELHADPVL